MTENEKLLVQITELEAQMNHTSERLGTHERWFERHDQFHKEMEERARQRNWQLWIILVTAVMGLVANLLVSVLK